MKKLSVILSVLLCLSMMTMGVSAETSKEILTGDDAFAIYEKCMKKMSKAEYLEIRGFMHETRLGYNPPRETREVGDFKFIVEPDGSLQAEVEIWDASGEKIDHTFIDGDYMYDSIEKEKYPGEAATMSEIIYSLTGADADDYKDDIENIRAEKLENGYRVWYISQYYYEAHEDKYTLIISDDFTLESVTDTYTHVAGYYSSKRDGKTTYRYEIRSMNRPFKINFPADLSRYDLT